MGVPWFKKSSGQDQPPAERVFGGPLSSIEPLRDDEVAWVRSTIAELVEQGVRTDDLDDLGRYYDEMVAGWHRLKESDRPDPDAVIRRIGLALGQYVADRTGLEWRVAIDDQGTEIALYRERGEVLVHPTRLVATRWVAREERVLPGLGRALIESIPDPTG